MCGIAGIVFREPAAPVDPATLAQLSDAIRHRGPDDEGRYIGDGAGLVMRRLSIIDLDGGRQPIANEDGTKVIVLNGEIYNYAELRRGLVARGHRFRTQGDVETVLHLYEELGAACVSRLRGMFAFAIWDATRRELFLARDRFGIKPLYFRVDRDGLGFASELRALLAAGLSRRDLDWEALDAFFELGYIPAPRTPFRDVAKLEPGHTLTWSARRGYVAARYWDLPAEVNAPAPDPATVAAWIDESVSAHLVSDVPVAAFLSGGIDSSAVAAAAAMRGAPCEAFTVRYTGSGAARSDESPLAHALSRRYGFALHTVSVGPEAFDRFDDIVTALDEPNADDSALPTWALSRAVGARFKVALTGAGGDELFGGYRRHLALRAAQRYASLPAALRQSAAWLADRLPEPRDGHLAVNRLKRFLRVDAALQPDVFLELLTRSPQSERAALYAAELRAAIPGRWAREQFRALYARSTGAPRGVRAARYLDYKTFLPDDILALADRLGMAHGLELRVPFVDHELVERVFPLPGRALVGFRELKRLLRRSQRDRLTPAHFAAPKRGFVGPTAAWLRHELRDRVRDELSSARVSRLGYFEPRAIARALREHHDGRHNHEGLLWALLTFSTWHRLFVESSATPVATARPARVASLLQRQAL